VLQEWPRRVTVGQGLFLVSGMGAAPFLGSAGGGALPTSKLPTARIHWGGGLLRSGGCSTVSMGEFPAIFPALLVFGRRGDG